MISLPLMSQNHPDKIPEKGQSSYKSHGIILMVASIVISMVFIYISSQRDLRGLENTLFQVLSLGVGLLGSYIFGRESAKDAALEIIKPHARSAFRRLISLYQSLSRVAGHITDAQRERENINSPVLRVLDAIVTEQLATADDALEDWRDIVPEEVQAVEARLKARKQEQKRLVSDE